MSHLKERKEKNCLNCNAEVAGRYCQVCGQENIETKESFRHLVIHFFNDITHYDGKFLNTVKYLLLRPGFLTAEYTRGRRFTYLHPIRMYVFTSAFFFLIFFSFIKKHEVDNAGPDGLKKELAKKKDELEKLQHMSGRTSDSVMLKAIRANIINRKKEIADLSARVEEQNNEHKNDGLDERLVIDSVTRNNINLHAPSFEQALDSAQTVINSTLEREQRKGDARKEIIDISGSNSPDIEFYEDEAIYRAIQKELPPERRDGVLEAALKQRLLRWHDQQEEGDLKAFHTLLEKFEHSFPTILFVSLPIFAFLLKLLYIRRRKFYYADHGIFAIHSYCAMFILMLLYYMADGLDKKWNWWGLDILKTSVVLYMIYYIYKAMKNYYAQGRFKTILKYIFLAWMTLIIMTTLIVIFFIISAAKN
ncbi:MAG: DUF3667 domain-containing protein [Chitinophagaceae bacterium]|nr:DUF3667 domain-containing protein [Chitinophagaceae bacterium]